MNAISTLTRPQHITSLKTSGMLVAVDMSVWTGTKQDGAISDEVTTAKHADREAGKFVKNLMAKCQTHKAVCNYRQTVKNWLRRRTYPWAGNFDYLPILALPEFKQEYDALQANWENKLLPEFFADYQQIVSNAAFVQGDMFNRDDYPTLDQLKAKFSMKLYTAEVPDNDFRVLVAQDLADDLHNNYERQTQDKIKEIVSMQSAQLVEVLESLSHSCTVEVTDGKVKRKKLYEGTVKKALQYCDLFKSFNLTSDPVLEQARAQLAAVLTDVPYAVLSESDSSRERVKHEVDDILSLFGAK